MRPDMPYSEADKTSFIASILALSAQNPGMLIVPGTIMWRKTGDGGATLNNTAIAVMNGQLLRETNKVKEGYDSSIYTKKSDSGRSLGSDKDCQNGRMD